MNAHRVKAATGVILGALAGRDSSAAGIAAALEAAGMLQSPESAAELVAYRALELGTPEGRISAKCDDSSHPVWLRSLDDVRGCPWCRNAELEVLTPAPVQTCQKCGAGYDYGKPCAICEFKTRIAAAIAEGPSEVTP